MNTSEKFRAFLLALMNEFGLSGIIHISIGTGMTHLALGEFLARKPTNPISQSESRMFRQTLEQICRNVGLSDPRITAFLDTLYSKNESENCSKYDFSKTPKEKVLKIIERTVL